MAIRDNHNKPVNPVAKYYKWSSKERSFSYYDKEAEMTIVVPELNFILLDRTAYISGYHQATSTGVISNFVKNTKEEILKVRTQKGMQIAEGLYADIKEKVQTQDGEYTVGIYGWDTDNKEMIHIAARGAVLGAMITAKPRMKDGFKYNAKDSGEELKNGGIKFFAPRFQSVSFDQDEYNIALNIGDVLAEYFKAYFASNGQEDTVTLDPKLVNVAKVAVDHPVTSGHEFGADLPDIETVLDEVNITQF